MLQQQTWPGSGSQEKTEGSQEGTPELCLQAAQAGPTLPLHLHCSIDVQPPAVFRASGCICEMHVLDMWPAGVLLEVSISRSLCRNLPAMTRSGRHTSKEPALSMHGVIC